MTYQDLRDFITNKMKLDQSDGIEKNYQPVVIRFLNQSENGIATSHQIKQELEKENLERELPSGSLKTVTDTLIRNNIIRTIDDSFQLIGFEEFNDAEKAWITNYCNERIDRPMGVKLTSDSIDDIISEFRDWVKTEEAQIHFQNIEKEKKEVQELISKLDSMDKNSPEFVELVLYGLLPHAKTQYAKRVSMFSTYLNIKAFLKRYDYTDDDWKKIANMVYDLSKKFQNDPEKLGEWLEEFTSNKTYIRNIQTGAISPILFCLNDNYPLINNRIRQTYKEFSYVLGWNDKMSRKIEDYVKSSKQIQKLIDELQVEEFKDLGVFDVFCYWYDYLRKQDVEDEDGGESEAIHTVVADVNYDDFFKSINFENFRRFDPHLLRNPERVKIRDIIQFCDQGKWCLPNFQRYFDWKQKDIRDLLESIFRDYYVGSFLMWDMDQEPPLSINPIMGANPPEDARAQSIILDGQQRMTSLYYAIKAPGKSTRRIKKPVYYYIDFNTFFSDKNREKDYVVALDKKLDNDESFNSLYFPFYELEKYDNWIEGLEEFLLKNTSENEKFHKMRRIIEKKVKHIYDGFEIPYISLPTTMGCLRLQISLNKLTLKEKHLVYLIY